MIKSMFYALAVGVAMHATAALSQTVTQPRQPGVVTPGQSAQGAEQYASPQGGASAAQLDQAIAACLALGNEEEVAINEFAKSHIKSDKVKQFAEKMVKDHREALAKLNQVAPQLASLHLQLNANAQPAAAPAAGDVHQQMLALQRNVAQQCLQLTQHELEESQGADFDRCFIGQQIGAHVAMLAKLKGSEQFATGQLRSFIQEATKTVEEHHKMAKDIAKNLMEEYKSAQRTDNARR